MIWASKIKSIEELNSANESFHTAFTPSDIVFGLYDNSIIAVGGLKKTDKNICELLAAFNNEIDERYKEMLIRAILSVIRDCDYIIKTTVLHDCFKILGFCENEQGIMQISTKNLVFDCRNK